MADIKTKNLNRIFKTKINHSHLKEIVALENVNLEIKPGELFGLLGPNGAGKTTLIKILATLLLPTSGNAYIDEIDVALYPQEVRKKINMVSGGEFGGYGILTVRENLWLFSQFYGISNKIAKKRIDKLLEVVELKEFENMRFNKLSTGMRQKLNFARGFINDPHVLFLDEPTLGLDVQISRAIRHFTKEWVKSNFNKTILLTTHYMMEAELLCDRVAIINHGKIIACDTPENLKKLISKDLIFDIEIKGEINSIILANLPGVKHFYCTYFENLNTTNLRFILSDQAAYNQIFSSIFANGLEILKISKTEPNLEDVFIELVGKGLEDESTYT